jgi:hypothetical protein
VTQFPAKEFMGRVYTFDHLKPYTVKVPLQSVICPELAVSIGFGSHCFTEAFDHAVHKDHHRYTHKGELRAFDMTRFECSLQLPGAITQLLSGKIYNANRSYTYVAQISLPDPRDRENYSIFFSLERNKKIPEPALLMFIKSAYIKGLAAPKHAQSWRFAALAGQIAGVYPAGRPKP